MTTPRLVWLTGVLLMAGTTAATAQNQPAAPSATPLAAHGSVDVGYRFQDVNGNADTFRQLFDLSDGVRIFGADLRATGGDATKAFDTLTLNASGLGGEPFPSVLLRMRRAKTYDLRVSWRRSRFFDVAPLTPASIDGFDTQAVTDHHSWDTQRELGNVALTFDASSHLQLLFTYDRMSRDGAIGSTRAVDFIGSPTAWGSFARANPFPVVGPVDDASNRFAGGLSYGRDRWTVHYTAGYQRYDESLVLDIPVSPERSINVGDAATANELLTSMTWNQSRRLTTPSSELSFVAHPAPAFEWRGEYFYYRASGPSSLDAAFAGTARTNATGTATSPYQVAITADGHGESPTHVAGQGVAYRPSRYWGVDLDYRYSNAHSSSEGDLTSALSSYTAAPANPQLTAETDALAWRQTLHTVRLTGILQPQTTLTIRPGVRYASRDILMEEDGVMNPATSHHDRTVTPELSVSYRPARWLTARGTLQTSSNDAAYTRMSPSDRTVAHLGVTVDPAEGLSITGNVDSANAKLTTASYESRIHGASLHASYVFGERVTAFGSFDYRSLLALGDTTFLRGVLPITNVVMQDSEVDRIWQGGITARLTAALEVTATGSYDRVTGTDEITGEPPLYGPLTFPFGTVSVSYNVPRVGRLAVDLQRTHYYQELLPMNDFRASMVVVRLTRGF